MLMALAYLLIAGMAYCIASWISSTGPSYWRSTTAFILALIGGWLGGVLLFGWLFSLIHPENISQITLGLIGSGFWCALFGAGYGVYRARFKLATGKPAPALSLPKWVTMAAAGVAVIGIAGAVALPAYQEYTKRQAPAVEADPYAEFLDRKSDPKLARGEPSEHFQYQEGVAARKRGDDASAANIFLPLAERGHLEAQFSLGSMYHFGDGVPKDYIASAKWYRSAANQGHAIAQSQLGMMYEFGQGVIQNYPEAVKLHRMAAKQGDSTGQSQLGLSYFLGRGVPVDNLRAHMWLNLAGVSDVSGASLRLIDRVAQAMTPQQIAQAQQMAHDCQQRNFSSCE